MALKANSELGDDEQVDLLREIASNGPGANNALKRLRDAYTHSKFAPFLRGKRYDNGALDDLLQEIWIGVAKSARTFRPGAPPSPWLWRIARNKWKDEIARRYDEDRPHYESLSDEGIDEDIARTEAQAVRDHLRPTATIEVCREWAYQRLQATHPEAADALRLVVIEGWDIDKLAEHLGREVHPTQQFLSQARKRVRGYRDLCMRSKNG